MMIRMLLGEVCIHKIKDFIYRPNYVWRIHKISSTYSVIGSLCKHIHKSLILSSTTSYIK